MSCNLTICWKFLIWSSPHSGPRINLSEYAEHDSVATMYAVVMYHKPYRYFPLQVSLCCYSKLERRLKCRIIRLVVLHVVSNRHGLFPLYILDTKYCTCAVRCWPRSLVSF